MEEGAFKSFVELSGTLIEIFGVVIIVGAFCYALIQAIFHLRKRRKHWFVNLKSFIGRSLQLSLEFLIAADIIRTILIESTMNNVAVLGLLVLVRTVLSWSIAVEIEGCWPWKMAELKKSEEG